MQWQSSPPIISSFLQTSLTLVTSLALIFPFWITNELENRVITVIPGGFRDMKSLGQRSDSQCLCRKPITLFSYFISLHVHFGCVIVRVEWSCCCCCIRNNPTHPLPSPRKATFIEVSDWYLHHFRYGSHVHFIKIQITRILQSGVRLPKGKPFLNFV